ncbi:hypothetical protein GJAV_G00108350 [Gymnothorax javanicus]|nr:hypothetical protein GJAV_G00108350 [Gymnothorax javanicus]
MSVLTRSKAQDWGVSLDTVEIATPRNLWDESSFLIGLNRRITRWFESPRLSTASSISGNDQTLAASSLDYPAQIGSALRESQRPASLVSTISSGSGSGLSQDGRSSDCGSASFEAPLPVPQDCDRDVDLDLCPAGGDEEGQRLGLGLATDLERLDSEFKTEKESDSKAANLGRAEQDALPPPFAICRHGAQS